MPVEEHESFTDPVVSFDGEWVYYAKFHHMAVGEAHMSRLRSQKGADIYKIHVPTRKIVQLTRQERTPNTGAIPSGTESHAHGVHNLAPCPVPGGRVVFCSDRNGYRGVREQTQPALQLFVMDEDGSNVELIGPLLVTKRTSTMPADEFMLKAYVEGCELSGQDPVKVLVNVATNIFKEEAARHQAVEELGNHKTKLAQQALRAILVESTGNAYLRRKAAQAMRKSYPREEACAIFLEVSQLEADMHFQRFIEDMIQDNCE